MARNEMKTTKLRPLVPLLCFLLSPSALAKGSFACASVEEIDKSAAECRDNIRFAEAAVRCLHQLKALVGKKSTEAQAQMHTSNEAHVGDGVNSQSSAMGGSVANYGLS